MGAVRKQIKPAQATQNRVRMRVLYLKEAMVLKRAGYP